MTNKIIDTLIKLNHQGKTLQEIAESVGMSWQQVWRLFRQDKRYKPGKRGFARLSKERMRQVASQGGHRANELGVSYRWDTKTASLASQKKNK